MREKHFNNLYCVFFILRKMPWFVAVTILHSLWSSMTAYVNNVFLLQKILYILEQGADFLSLFVWLCGMAAFGAASTVYATLYSEIWAPKFNLLLEKKFYEDIFKKASSVNILCFDDPQLFDDYVFSSESIVESAKKALTLVSDMISCTVNIALVAISYSRMALPLFSFILGSIGLTFLMKSLSVKLSYQKNLDLVAPRRKASYFKDVFFLREPVKERLISDVDILLKENYRKSIEEQIAVQKKYGFRLSLINWVTDYFCSYVMLGIGIILFLLYQLVFKQAFLLSEFVPLYRGADIVASSFKELFERKLPNLMDNAKRIRKYRMFTELKNEEVNAGGYVPSKEPESIELKNLAFTYPNNDAFALKGIDMTLKPGSVVALVGRNGAGKSTLAGILTGLLSPTSGEISINGHPLSAVNMYAYRQKCSIIFQNDRLLSVTIGENLALDREYDSERVQFSAELCGLPLKERGIAPDTFVGREIFEDGLILSGGEVQKLLLARCIYRDLPYIVLDEPSAALDAKAEYEFNRIVSEIAGKERKTIFVITHRLTTITMADYIYVMDGGRIVEQGEFRELKAGGGLFAKMWEAQAEKYSLGSGQ